MAESRQLFSQKTPLDVWQSSEYAQAKFLDRLMFLI